MQGRVRSYNPSDDPHNHGNHHSDIHSNDQPDHHGDVHSDHLGDVHPDNNTEGRVHV